MGQSDVERAFDLAIHAEEEIEAGNFSEAIDLLDKARALDPKKGDYGYQSAYAYSLAGQSDQSISILKKLVKHDDATDRYYQLLGQCQMMENQIDKAITTYEKGLKQFPGSGRLYLELGHVKYHSEDHDAALSFYEQGIDVEPTFASNYYWATRLYLDSPESVWGMLYGELFMNLERNSPRTAEVSQWLYECYQKNIEIKDNGAVALDFSQQTVLSFHQDQRMAFGIAVYEPTMLAAYEPTDQLDLESIAKIRYNFVQRYFESGHYQTHPIVLFQYQKEVIAAGHMAAYSRWILMKGDEVGFNTWHRKHQDEWTAFVSWFREHPIQINDQNHFHSKAYR